MSVFFVACTITMGLMVKVNIDKEADKRETLQKSKPIFKRQFPLAFDSLFLINPRTGLYTV
jgi:hypothetical protein